MPPTATPPPGLIIAAPRSGAGKTTVTLGVLRALARRGMAVQPFKCGPDYIDPAFHTAAAARPSYNLDSWAMQKSTVTSIISEQTVGASFVVAEALMGLFDGVASPGAWGTGASADIAELTGWPVVLVLDVSGQSQTAAAAARGFINFRPGVSIAGVILNRVASDRHFTLTSGAFADHGIPIFGAIPRQSELRLPERHLGLVQAQELPDLVLRLDGLADLVEKHIQLDALLTAARPGVNFTAQPTNLLAPPGQRIALASDAAFSFVYPHVTAAWRAEGAEIFPFSPLADEAPDQTCDVAWLPGGYPELHAARLANNLGFKAGLRSFAERHPVHGECGGYMVLGDALEDGHGVLHPMLGLLDLETSFAKRRMSLGYRSAYLRENSLLGPAGTTVRGHEFHYATTTRAPALRLADVSDASGNATGDSGGRRGNVTGTFFHVIDGSPAT